MGLMAVQAREEKIALGGSGCGIRIQGIKESFPHQATMFVTTARPVYAAQISGQGCAVDGVARIMAIGTETDIISSFRAIRRGGSIRLPGSTGGIGIGRLVTAVGRHQLRLAPEVEMVGGFGDGAGKRGAEILIIPLGKMGVMASVTRVGILAVPGEQDALTINKIMNVTQVMVGALVKGFHNILGQGTRGVTAEGGGVITIDHHLRRGRGTMAVKADIISHQIGARHGARIEIGGEQGVGAWRASRRRWLRAGHAGMRFMTMEAIAGGKAGGCRALHPSAA